MKASGSQYQFPTVERVSQVKKENETKQIGSTSVKLNAFLESNEFKESDAALPIVLGMTDDGKPYITDLATLPHLLIGGKTGYGKSICLNALITSLLHKKLPDELKFVLFDPKVVDFLHFNSIENQYLAKLPGADPIVSDKDKVMPVLNSLLVEMDNRFCILRDAKVRNVNEYNTLLKSGKLKSEASQKPLPYLVVIVDELAVLMMENGSGVTKALSTLAINGNTAGIHLILATNYPSVLTVTGIIKALIPGRIAFKVDTEYDSRVLIDRPGAQDLVIPGEMIFVNTQARKHLQCSFISREELKALCDYIASQPFTGTEPYLLPTPMENIKI